jgi:hypothetical protein
MRKALSPRHHDANSCWYVLLLRERNAKQIAVRYVKVKGVDAALHEVLMFLSGPRSGFRDFSCHWFVLESDADRFLKSNVTAGMIAGARPAASAR